MSDAAETYQQLKKSLSLSKATLVAVSKIQPPARIQDLYDAGQRDFGENYVQELLEKQALLPKDIRWHLIGHLQSNKVKQIIPFVHLVQGVDSDKLLKEINKQSQKAGLTTSVLLQVFIANEETKFGLNAEELDSIMNESGQMHNVHIRGLMGMASFTDDQQKVKNEFASLRGLFEKYKDEFARHGEPILSMGMSGDYKLALDEGSNMVRIGSLLFGQRPPKKDQ